MSPHVISRSFGTQVVGLGGWLLLTFAAAAIGGLASVQAGSFYAQLERPDPSLKGSANCMPPLALISFWTKRVLPLSSAWLKCWMSPTKQRAI
jgi:hypothetical protein